MVQTFLFFDVIRNEMPVNFVQLGTVASLRDISQGLQVPIIFRNVPRIIIAASAHTVPTVVLCR